MAAKKSKRKYTKKSNKPATKAVTAVKTAAKSETAVRKRRVLPDKDMPLRSTPRDLTKLSSKTPEQLERETARAARKASRGEVSPVAAKVDGADDDMVVHEMPELWVYKLQHLETLRTRELARLRMPLVEKAELQLREYVEQRKQELNDVVNTCVGKLLKTDQAHADADNAYITAVNEAIDGFVKELPKGHAVVFISPETKEWRSKHSPDQRDTRLPLRELKKE